MALRFCVGKLARSVPVLILCWGCADDQPSDEPIAPPTPPMTEEVVPLPVTPEMQAPGQDVVERVGELFPLRGASPTELLAGEPSCSASTDEWDLTDVECKLADGGVQCSLWVSAFEGTFFEGIGRCDITGDTPAPLRAALSNSIAEELRTKSFSPDADGWQHKYTDREVSPAAAAVKITHGTPSGAAIPRELRQSYFELTREQMVGTHCGISGRLTRGYKAMHALTAAGRADLLRDALVTSNPSAQIYGYVGLLKLERATVRDRRAFDALLREDPIVQKCSGCMWTQGAVSEVDLAGMQNLRPRPIHLR